jgi:hypothetical protein
LTGCGKNYVHKNEPLKKEKGSVNHENLEPDTTHRSQIGKGKSYIKRTPSNFLEARERKFHRDTSKQKTELVPSFHDLLTLFLSLKARFLH